MKVIHIADIHWRGLSRHKEYRESFEGFFQKARALNPDIIYVGGDIVHSKTQGISPELIDSLCWWFKGLSDIAPTHVILGNHDGLVLNKDRQDAITPIIEALEDPNIHLYKKSGVYPIKNHEEFNWCVFSCFDEPGWKDIYIDSEKINIALFHGAVWGSKTDIDWDIEGDVTVDLFKDFDFTMLGDIHKKQFLDKNKTIGYSGSTIQQNYGEDPGKGFLFWDIRGKDDFDVEFYEIPHYMPFITVEWQGSVSDTVSKCFDFQDGARFRIKSKITLSQSDSKELQFILKKEKEAAEVVFKSESSMDVSRMSAAGNALNRENLRDPVTHKSLIRDYYKGQDIKESELKEFDILIEKYISQLSENQKTLRNTRWQINKLSFDNLFSYGEGNVINFDNLSGITGIFGKNTKGKSSIIGSLMYGLFNTTDRGPIKNLHIINSRKDNCNAYVDITLNGDPLRISRSTIKHQTRKGEVYASTSLKVHKLNAEGEIVEDLTDEQRRETEKILRNIIGTHDDFLMTSLASQGEMNTFIKEGASSRKLILTKFLDLEVFEKMYDMAKSDSSEIRSLSRSQPALDWDEKIDDLKFKIIEDKNSLENANNAIEDKRKLLSSLKIRLATSDTPDVVTRKEYDSHLRNFKDANLKIKTMETERKSLCEKISAIEDKILKIENFAASVKIDEFREKIEFQRDLEKSILDLAHIAENQKQELDRQKKSIKKLKDVPCGDSFPKCKFIKDSHSDKSLIEKQKNIVKECLKSLTVAKKSLTMILKEEYIEKIEKYETLLKKKSEMSITASELKIKNNNLSNEIGILESKQIINKKTLDEMKARVASSESPSFVIRSNISKIEKEIQLLDSNKMNLFEKMTKRKAEIEQTKNSREEFKKIKRRLKVYDLFMQAISKKGIPLQIMMSQLPLINSELSKILQGVTGFTVELEAEPETNAMDIFINYGDSRRIIELASGMEKMMSSLAIRVALINVSSLTKTNMLIIDEGFGALDDTNIEACSRLLESLKKWFKNIVIISHVDAIKDSVDNSLEIIKNGKDSKVYSI